MQDILIKDFPDRDKPRERLFVKGAAALSDYELLSILLGSGGKGISAVSLAKAVLSKYGGFAQLLKAGPSKLRSESNIGPAKSSRFFAAMEIYRRIQSDKSAENGITISSAEDVFRLMLTDIQGKDKEILFLVSMDTRNRLISKDVISIGTINQTLTSPRELYRVALLRNAVSVIMIHNHPSQDTQPSSEDIEITLQLCDAGRAVGINFLDHVIVCDTGYTSMKTLGLLKNLKLGGR